MASERSLLHLLGIASLQRQDYGRALEQFKAAMEDLDAEEELSRAEDKTKTAPAADTDSILLSYARGSILTQTDASNQVTGYAYDTRGNLKKQTDALGHETTYTVDFNGNRLSQTTTRTVGGAVETADPEALGGEELIAGIVKHTRAGRVVAQPEIAELALRALLQLPLIGVVRAVDIR